MLIRHTPPVRPSETTPRDIFLNRRHLVIGAAALGFAALSEQSASAALLQAIKSPLSTDERLTPRKDVTSYNNYYEFGTDKGDPAANAHTLTTKPCTVAIEGLVARPTEFHLEDLVSSVALEASVSRYSASLR